MIDNNQIEEINTPFASDEKNQENAPTIDSKYDEILKMAGKDGCGKFQFLVFTSFLSGFISIGYIYYILSFLELMRQFDCVIDGEKV